MKSINTVRTAAMGMLLLTIASACSIGQTEKTEATVAEIEAAQMEGREAAKLFLARDITDTMTMQHSILEARAKQSKYVMDKKPECVAAFDTAFISTLRSVRPDLAKEISGKVF